MRKHISKAVSAGLFVFLLLVATAATSSAQPRTEYRAFWVDTFNTLLDNEANVVAVVNQARQAKANAIFVQIRRRGDSWYLNSLEPRADRRTFPAGFDPLQSLINNAHSSDPTQHIEIHAFVIVGAIWNRDPRCATLQPPTGHAFLSNGAYDPATTLIDPDRDDNWLTRTLIADSTAHTTTCPATGTPIPAIGFNGQRFGAEFWIDLGHPDAAAYTNDVLMHLVDNYDIDGLHLDRIRFPEFAASGQTPANGTSIGYNKTSVTRFNSRHARTGTPAQNDALWSQWRRDQVTNLVRRLYLNAIDRKPNLKVSAALIAFGAGPTTEPSWNSAEAYWRVYQDWRSWTEEGILDLAIPMAYKAEHVSGQVTQFDQWNEWTKNHQYRRGALIGLGNLNNAVEGTLRQTRRALLFPSAQGNNALGSIFYSMATSNIAVASNPFRRPTAGATAVRSFAEFASALKTGRSIDGLTEYEDPVANPAAVFADSAQIPVLTWKSAPTVGHIKGFAKRSDATILDTADMTITNIDTNATRSGKTDGGGFFGGVDLAPGQYFAKATLGADTVYTCVATVSAGIVTTSDASPETTAPTTTATLSPAAPNGENGWYTTDVTLDLAATDGCTGVARTEYSLDGGTTWTPYTGQLSFTTEGVFNVLYRSIDRAGNVESTSTTTIKIDKTAPTVSLTADPSKIWPPNGKMVDVTIGGTGSDAISGLASATYVVTDEYGDVLSIDPRTLTGTSAIWTEVLSVEARRRGDDRDGRLYRVTITVKDAAGLWSTATVDVLVSHDQRK